jgi:hypothetical protein
MTARRGVYVRRIFAISRYDLAVLLLVVVDMVVKPGVGLRASRRSGNTRTISR